MLNAVRGRIFPGRALYLCQWAALFAFLTLNGCGKNAIPTIGVEGNVSYKGQPVTQGTIAFHPVVVFEGRPRRIATGKIGQDGKFALSTFRQGDGVIPGEYKVTIVSREARKSFDSSDEEVAALKSFVPTVYSNPDQTPLKETVPADATVPLHFDFVLEGDL